MRKRVISLVLVGMLSLVGCGGGDSSELEAERDYYESMYFDALDQLDESAALLETLQGYTPTGPSFSAMSIDNDKLSFNTYDSKIIFPEEFGYPGSKEVMANTLVRLTDSVKVTPGSNWIMKFSGSTLELENTGGISAMIKVGEIDEYLKVDVIKEDVLKPWFEQVTDSIVKYSTIFMDGNSKGVQAQTPIYIDGEEAYLVCGIVGSGSTSVTYIVVFRGKSDANKLQTVHQLISSIAINGTNLVVTND